MIWTVIAINLTTEKAEHHVFDSLAHDSEEAHNQANELLPGYLVVAMVKGDHQTGTHMPNKIISVVHSRRGA